MTRAAKSWSIGAIVFVVLTAVLGAAVSRWTNYVLDRVERHGFGYKPDPAGTREFLADLEQPTFAQAGRECLERAQNRDAFLYRIADEAHRSVYGKPFVPWNQGPHGSCVSFGWGLGSYYGQAIAWKAGELPAPPKLVATEPIYGGSRTMGRSPPVSYAGFSEGSYGAAAARWVAGKCKDPTVGGILFRERYGDVDLTSYSIPLSRNWGAYGVPLPLAREAATHRAQAVALVTSWDELVAALGSGYVVPICSNVGFAATRTRDADGFLPRGGQWSHCMLLCSLKFAANSGTNGEPPMKNPRDGVLCVNSWGAGWCDGPKHPADQPDGSFWMTKADAEAILRQGDSFAIGSVDGFRYRDLEHREWLQPQIEGLTMRDDP